MLIAEDVVGFEKLHVNTDMFKRFLVNFYNSWGEDARATIRPIKIKYCKDKANGPYLRFDYEMYGKKEWLHVKNDHKWY
jgi:hypothetical protein